MLTAILTVLLTAFSAERPNIVWISVEDMSPWLACYGDDTAPTPNIDRLAREGVRYANAHANTPVCAPARSTLITGMYATTIGSMHMRTGNPSGAALERDPNAYDGIPNYEAVPPPEVRCFTEHLREVGYHCTNRSKQDYQFKAPVTAWDASGGKAHWRQRDGDQPFFAVFNITGTHESGTFPNRRAPKTVVDTADVEVPPYFPDTPLVRSDIARTYDNIVAMDGRVGSIMQQLETDGLLEDTIVVFFSDHGVGLPRGKRSIYASGTHVPLIIRWPDGRGAGTVEDRPVAFVDFAPTMLSLAGVPVPGHMQGHVFAGDEADPPVEHVFINADRMDSVTDRTRAVTDGRYRYVRNGMTDRPRLYPVAYAENIPMMADIHALRDSGEATPAQWQMVSPTKPEEELYDRSTDPHEVVNRIDDPELAAVRATLSAALDAWIERTGDLGMLPEGEMVRERLWAGAEEKPRTAAPVLSRAEDGRITITCATDGATIGYRLGDTGPWSIYTEDCVVPDDEALTVRADRIGFAPSADVRWTSD